MEDLTDWLINREESIKTEEITADEINIKLLKIELSVDTERKRI